ncbi:hypothetical protein [Azospirillum argentinense]
MARPQPPCNLNFRVVNAQIQTTCPEKMGQAHFILDQS